MRLAGSAPMTPQPDLLSLLVPIYTRAFAQSVATSAGLPDSSAGGPANPLVILPPRQYASSALKVMYVGQETCGYEQAFNNSKGVEHLLGVYDDFANKGGMRKHAKAFCNAIGKFNGAFSEIEPSTSFLWNNIIKIGKDWSKGAPPESVLTWQDHWFGVLREEMQILSPDVVIFFTGPNYDRFIEKAFGPFTAEPVGAKTTRQLARLVSEHLPVASFRTYHPNYLWRHGFYDYLKDIVGEVKKSRDSGEATPHIT
jgi:hypothetical protein